MTSGVIIRPCGLEAVLLEVEDRGQVLDRYEALSAHAPAGVRDVVPSQVAILVSFDPAVTTLEAVVAWIGAVPAVTSSRAAAAAVQIAVTYDGEDLAAVAAAAGMTSEEVVRAHTAAEFRVAFCGFTPGFAYLSGLPVELQLPRRSTPRTRVPAGSVAIASEFSAVYPQASPGGWHLLGRADVRMWDLDREVPGLLSPGDTVRFIASPP
ncbi:MAG: allophanate hydrolase [Frankiales bacterium]|nr:allophanate hydrolase [Frankiales bacterium]